MDLAALKKEARASTTSATRLLALSQLDDALAKYIAKLKHAPVSVLDVLVKHANTSVQLAVANNSAASAQALTYLGGHGKFTILKAVAKNPSTPAATLIALASHKQLSVREALLEHPALPSAVLDVLATQADLWRFYLCMRQGSQLGPNAIRSLLSAGTTERRGVALYAPLSPELTQELFDDDAPSVRVAIVTNKSLTKLASWQQKLLTHEDEKTRAAFARNQTSQAFAEQFVSDPSALVRAASVGHLRAKPEHLARLARDSSELVRAAVAGRFFGLSTELITLLAHDSSPFVRAHVAQNRDAPEAILAKLAQDEHELVRFAACCNSDCPTETLEQLSSDSSERVFHFEADPITKSPELKVTIAERAAAHLEQRRNPRSAERYPQPHLNVLFKD